MTYRELLAVLNEFTDKELDQEAQILPHCVDGDCVIPLEQVVGFGTIGYFLEGTQKVRSNVDNKHHDNEWVLLADLNMYGEDDSIATNLMTGEKIYPEFEIYSEDIDEETVRWLNNLE